MDNKNLIEEDNQSGRKKYYKKVDRALMFSILFVTFGVLISVVISSIFYGNGIINQIQDTNDSLKVESARVWPDGTVTDSDHLPKRYAVPYVTPVKDQQHRGTCWAFSSMGVLEASYRANGIKKGFLKEDEYVTFSEQAFSLGVVDYCSAHPDEDLCYISGPSTNSTEDGEPEWIYYFDGKIPKALPEAACPYFGTNDNEFTCPDRQKKAESNPISYKVKKIASAYTVNGIKKLIYEKELPLTWSHIVASQTYMLPCTDKRVNQTQVCTECHFPSNGKCDAIYILPSYDNEGKFALHGQPFMSGGHAMVLVGYNDNMLIKTTEKQQTTGGFIIKNSWGSGIGHSIRYWMSEISDVEEAMICPDETAATKWLPANHTCVLGGRSVSECSASLFKRVRDNWVSGATVLKCRELAVGLADFLGFGSCDHTKHYVLAKTPDIADVAPERQPSAPWTEPLEDSDGFFKAYLIAFDPKTGGSATLVSTEPTTWYGLSKLFEPADEIAGNDPEQCGYFFLPYQYFQEGTNRSPKDGHDANSITFMSFVWDDSSYLKNKDQYHKYDYTYLEQSTKKLSKRSFYEFKGPLDYEYKNDL